MSTFSQTTFKATEYAIFRPTYPSSLYKHLFHYHQGQNQRALDIGCGSGQATCPLLSQFQQVLGIDPSKNMIESAKLQLQMNNNINNNNNNKDKTIQFEVLSSEGLNQFPSESQDMIISAQAIHWFGTKDDFFKQVYRVLKPKGTLAYWGYNDPVFINNGTTSNKEVLQKVNNLVLGFMYDEDQLGKYWEQPGRQLLRGNMEVVYPQGLTNAGFVDLQRFVHHPVTSSHEEEVASPLIIKKKGKLSEYFQYVQTWSCYHTWKQSHPTDQDISEIFLENLKKLTGWDDDTMVEYEFITFLSLARKP